jgi:hypothetical protein
VTYANRTRNMSFGPSVSRTLQGPHESWARHGRLAPRVAIVDRNSGVAFLNQHDHVLFAKWIHAGTCPGSLLHNAQ